MATYTDYFGLIRPDLADNASITQLNQNTTKIDLVMHQNRQMSADAYDPQRVDPYDEGELAIFENVLYRCKEDNVSGNWNPTKWEVTTLAKEIANGGGGSTVIANPSGTASTDLTKLGIDGVNYNIPSGGGGYSTTPTEVCKWIDGTSSVMRVVIPYSDTIYPGNGSHNFNVGSSYIGRKLLTFKVLCSDEAGDYCTIDCTCVKVNPAGYANAYWNFNYSFNEVYSSHIVMEYIEPATS